MSTLPAAPLSEPPALPKPGGAPSSEPSSLPAQAQRVTAILANLGLPETCSVRVAAEALRAGGHRYRQAAIAAACRTRRTGVPLPVEIDALHDDNDAYFDRIRAELRVP